jgi:hypothetical protein
MKAELVDYSGLVDTESDDEGDDGWTGAALRRPGKPNARAWRRAVIDDSEEEVGEGRGLRGGGYQQRQSRGRRDGSSDGDRERIAKVSSRPVAHILRGSSDGALSSAATASSAVFSEEPLLSTGRAASIAPVPKDSGESAGVHSADGGVGSCERNVGVASGTGSAVAVGRRDTAFSSLHSVNKLLTAKLGERYRCGVATTHGWCVCFSRPPLLRHISAGSSCYVSNVTRSFSSFQMIAGVLPLTWTR